MSNSEKSEVTLELKIPISETQTEIVLDNLIYNHDLYTVKSEYKWINDNVKSVLAKDGTYSLLKIVSANLDTDVMVWVCECIAYKRVP